MNSESNPLRELAIRADLVRLWFFFSILIFHAGPDAYNVLSYFSKSRGFPSILSVLRVRLIICLQCMQASKTVSPITSSKCNRILQFNNLSTVIEHVQHECKPFVLQLQSEMLLVASNHLLTSGVYFPQQKPAENNQGTVSFWRLDYDPSQIHQKSTEI